MWVGGTLLNHHPGLLAGLQARLELLELHSGTQALGGLEAENHREAAVKIDAGVAGHDDA